MPWAPVQSARKGMGPSHGSHVDGTHLPSKLMESIQLTLALPSGRGENVTVPSTASVVDLKRAAQEVLGYQFLKLITADGNVLRASSSLESVGLRDGDAVTVILQQPNIAASLGAFALWCNGGDRVITWGQDIYGGDVSEVQDHLQEVTEVVGRGYLGFAATLADGRNITWPLTKRERPRIREMPPKVPEELKEKLREGKDSVKYTGWAGAAILRDGTVAAWGGDHDGGNNRAVQDQLKEVDALYCTSSAFAAVLSNGRVVTWGNNLFGGDSGAVQDQLRDVQKIESTQRAFAAIRSDGGIVTWGQGEFGGDLSGAVREQFLHL